MHWGNILVKETKEKCLPYFINGIQKNINTAGLEIAVIDFTLSRLEKGFSLLQLFIEIPSQFSRLNFSECLKKFVTFSKFDDINIKKEELDSEQMSPSSKASSSFVDHEKVPKNVIYDLYC